jgi:hypothetical protein
MQFRAMAIAKWVLPAPVPPTRTTLRRLLILKLTIFIGSDGSDRSASFQWKFRLFALMMSMCKSGT